MATKNFKTQNVTPKTLNIASVLINLGARREEIVKNLYQSRFLSTLKLWGRVLSRLNNDLDDRLVWSSLSCHDFLETASKPSEAIDVIDELILSMPKTEIIILLYENYEKIDVIVYSTKNINSLELAKKFNPIGNKQIAKFTLENMILADAERTIITEIKSKL